MLTRARIRFHYFYLVSGDSVSVVCHASDESVHDWPLIFFFHQRSGEIGWILVDNISLILI